MKLNWSLEVQSSKEGTCMLGRIRKTYYNFGPYEIYERCWLDEKEFSYKIRMLPEQDLVFVPDVVISANKEVWLTLSSLYTQIEWFTTMEKEMSCLLKLQEKVQELARTRVQEMNNI